jgi:futalosine hydrolase
MNILIVSATRFEIQPLLDLVRNISPEENRINGTYGNHKVTVLLTGVGMVATAYHCGKSITGDYDLAINAGICGSFNRNLALGDVVNIYEDNFSELGAEDGDEFLDLHALDLPGVSTVVNKREQFDNRVVHELPRVTGISVNTTHGKQESIDKVFSRLHPFVESMEGAAFMFACEQQQIPYLQIRAVSNYVERRNKSVWDIPLAIENLNKKLMEVLNAYS